MARDEHIERPELSQREQTDESLRIERDKADARIATTKTATDDEADRVVQEARDHADLAQRPPVPGGTIGRARDLADALLEDKRSNADAKLEEQRADRARYLADFLAAEREATDEDMIRERDIADRLVSTRDEFLANVSHDIRSLLSALGMNTELLLKHAPEGPASDPTRRYAVANQRLAARMNRLVNDLLDVSSIDGGRMSLLIEPV